MLLSKYMSLEDPDRVEAVLRDERIYCPKYDTLNDPCEGILGATPPDPPESGVNLAFIQRLGDYWKEHRAKVGAVRICSLSKDPSNVLMWSHYANGFSGLCVSFEVDDSDARFSEIEYVRSTEGRLFETPRQYLSVKLDCWSYEKEVRYFSDDEWLDISGRIRRVTFGVRMPADFMETYLKYAVGAEWTAAMAQMSHTGEISVR